MAGDWIRMRLELWTHPKFLSLCEALIFDEERPGLLIYTCGAENLGIGCYPVSEDPVTTRALQCVTECALRDVTMVTLLRVWGAVNSHCKVVGTDAVCSPMALSTIDLISGVEGFGEALKSVGWVVEREDNTLVFPNFCEYNSPACVRPTPKTNAQRQREFRERKKEKRDGVTRVTKVTRDERREDERRDEPPLPPLGCNGGGGISPSAGAEEKTPIPRTPPQDSLVVDWGFAPEEAAELRERPGISPADEALWRQHLVGVRAKGRVLDPMAYTKSLMRRHRTPQDASGTLAAAAATKPEDPEKRRALEARVQSLATAAGLGSDIVDSQRRSWGVGDGGLYGVHGFRPYCGISLADLESLAAGANGSAAQVGER